MHSTLISGADDISANRVYHWCVWIVSALLMLTGSCVLLSWHTPQLLASIYPYTTLMAYNTAIAFIACGLGLLALIKQESTLLIICSLLLFVIGILTLLDLAAGFDLNTTHWFEVFLSEEPIRSQPISPTTSTLLILAGFTLLFGHHVQGTYTLITSLLCLLMVLILVAGVIGQGFGVFPTFIWLGINMAPQTALGLLMFSCTIIGLRYRAAIDAFNRLDFFKRLITGFIFMSLLFLILGSTGLMQINKVAAISQRLYEGPAQTNKAILQVRSSTDKLNRTIKDIAVNPTLSEDHNIPQLLEQTERNIYSNLDIIQRNAIHQDAAIKIDAEFKQWRNLALDAYEQLKAGNLERYREMALTLSQEKTYAIEILCDAISQQTQEQMQQLNEEAIKTRNNAWNLMLVVIGGFLAMGVLVSGLITRSLSWQLERIRQTMLELANGNTQITIPFADHPHEIGDIAQTLKVFAQNIDERNKAVGLLEQHQQDLENTNQRLARTNKELETFAYVASHDLKSPLRGIAQLSNWIDEDLEAKEFAEVEKHTSMLRSRIHRMEKLLDDMLIFYRAGKIDGNLVSIDVAHITKELFEIQNTKPGLRLELGDALPVIQTLGTPFEQILRNLFSNAIKHHDRDEGIIRLEAQQINPNFYEFSVTDDGPGIPAKFQDRVFGMFQTLRSRDEQEGSGMGLALIKKLVETYGGSIRVFSEGRGCRFTFSWPIHINTSQITTRTKGHD